MFLWNLSQVQGRKVLRTKVNQIVSCFPTLQTNINRASCQKKFTTSAPRSLYIQGSRIARGPEIDQVPPKVRQKNLVVAGLCLLFTGGVYTYSISKLKEDELSALEEEAININLHESGLKATKVKELLDQIEKAPQTK